jgi:hypothetical protein
VMPLLFLRACRHGNLAWCPLLIYGVAHMSLSKWDSQSRPLDCTPFGRQRHGQNSLYAAILPLISNSSGLRYPSDECNLFLL